MKVDLLGLETLRVGQVAGSKIRMLPERLQRVDDARAEWSH